MERFLPKSFCLEKDALRYLHYTEILAITGVRRSGKTYLMYALMQHLVNQQKVLSSQVLYLNFEDERLALIEPSDLELIHQWFLEYSSPKGKLYFFLDEIQNVPLWEKWLSRSYESIKFVISGSNATLLSSELSSALTGRHVEMEVYPFSFKEYLHHLNIPYDSKKALYSTESKAAIAKAFSHYCQQGGFPEVLLKGKKDLLSQYYKDILLRDVIARYNIRHKDYLEKLAFFLLSNISRPVSLYALNKIYPLGINTIKNYLYYLEKSFLFFFYLQV